MIPVNLKEQLLPGTFEFTLNEVIDNHIGLTSFNEYYNKDNEGQPGGKRTCHFQFTLKRVEMQILCQKKGQLH
jgi:hypothetical protein